MLSFLGGPSASTTTVSMPDRGEQQTSALLMQNKNWLVNYIHNKLLLVGTTVPRLTISAAGTFSSTAFTSYLIDDYSEATAQLNNSSNDKNLIQNQSVDSFLLMLQNKALLHFKDKLDLRPSAR